jgi:hypothetical protein
MSHGQERYVTHHAQLAGGDKMEGGQGTAAMQSVRERIRGTWQAVDDADIERTGGSLDKLVSIISLKTGQPRAEVRKELRRIHAA